MRLVCPSCEATYEVPDAVLGAAPRRLKCAKCQQEWTVDPAVDGLAAAGASRTGPMARLAAAGIMEDTGVASGGAPSRSMLADPGFADERDAVAPADGELAMRPDGPLPPLGEVQWKPIASPGASRTAASLTVPPRERSPRLMAALLAWVLTVVTLMVIIAASYIWRADVMRVFPPSQRVYAALGIR